MSLRPRYFGPNQAAIAEKAKTNKAPTVPAGVKGKKVTWLASFAAVVHLPDQPPVVFYNGRLVRVDGEHRAIFRDGSVLTLAAGVTAPKGADVVRAEIDPATQRVRALVAG